MGCDVFHKTRYVNRINIYTTGSSMCVPFIFVNGHNPTAQSAAIILFTGEGLRLTRRRKKRVSPSLYSVKCDGVCDVMSSQDAVRNLNINMHTYMIYVYTLYIPTGTTQHVARHKNIFLLLACDGVWDVMFFTRRGTYIYINR